MPGKIVMTSRLRSGPVPGIVRHPLGAGSPRKREASSSGASSWGAS
jgi:hypothetical protein